MEFDLSTNRINNEPISRVYNCDNMIFMKEVPDKFFNLCICDPPYGISAGYGTRVINKNKTWKCARDRKPLESKEWDINIPKEEYFNELMRVSKDQIIWGGQYFTNYLEPNNNWIIWDKKVTNNTFSPIEMAWSSISKCKIFYYLMEGYKREDYSEFLERIHPTQKPIKLYKWLLTNYAKPGDKIFDSHLGSQSSRIASYHLGFDFWGTELDKDYFKDGCERFERECHEIYTLKNGTTIKQQNLF
jgi:site-specific DNA-methyltransferase (adenine-specific)